MIHGQTEEIKNIYDLYPIETLNPNTYDGVIISVGHKNLKKWELIAF